MKDGEKSLAKMFQILEAISEKSNGSGAKELIEKLQLPRSTVFRMLKFLNEKGYVKNKGNIYFLGNMLLRLGNMAVKQNSLIRIAHPHLMELAGMTKETSHLAELKGNNVIYIDKVEGSRSVRMGSMTGSSSPLYCTGIGKAILAFLQKDELEEKLESMEFKKFTASTIRTKKALLCEIESIRETGISFDKGEHEDGVFCIAAPIFDSSEKVIAAVSVAGAEIYVKKNASVYAKSVRGTARAISNELGK